MVWDSVLLLFHEHTCLYPCDTDIAHIIHENCQQYALKFTHVHTQIYQQDVPAQFAEKARVGYSSATMRALITGINGFVAGHLTEHLLAKGGWEVWGLTRSGTITLPQLAEHVRPIRADLSNVAAVQQALAQVQPQVIFHLAGQPFVPEAFRDPAGTFHTNVINQVHLFLALIEQRLTTRFLSVGSSDIYGVVRPDDLPIDEETALRPANPYAVSKAAQDLLAFQYSISHQLDVVRVRPFNHIGPRQNERFVSASFAEQIACIEAGLQPPLIKVGNLTAQRDFTDVRDIVRAYVQIVESGESGQVYNIGSGNPIMIRALLDTLRDFSTVPIDIQTDPERMRPVDVPLIVCDAGRLHACTGWQPQISIQQTLHDILEDWRQRIANR